MLVEGFEYILVCNIEAFIGLSKLLFAFEVNLKALIVFFSFLDKILELEDRYLESLLLDFREFDIDRGELFLVFGLLYEAEVSLEVPLVLLLLAQGLVPGNQ